MALQDQSQKSPIYDTFAEVFSSSNDDSRDNDEEDAFEHV